MSPISRNEMRELLLAILRTDDDLEAFVGDFFEGVAQEWGKGMSRSAKLTDLFNRRPLAEVWDVFSHSYPTEAERFLARRAHQSSSQSPSSVSPASQPPPRTRIRTPVPSDIEYKRVVRGELVERIIENQLRYRRLATLLEIHSGGGKTLARQIVARYKRNHNVPVLWLVDAAHESSSLPDCYSLLTDDMSVRSQPEFATWLARNAGSEGALIILIVKRAPERFFEEVAAVLSGFRSTSCESALIVVGGARILCMRHDCNYWWSKLIDRSSYVDVPDLTEAEVQELLVLNNLPIELAPLFHTCTGGHPALLYELIRCKIGEPLSAHATIRDLISSSRRLNRHLADPQTRSVMQRLLNGEEVNQLSNSLVRHEPAFYAEARMYFDGLLVIDRKGKTAFRCMSVTEMV